jgi:ABC-type antimicrobial peptide transport system permease subunit
MAERLWPGADPIGKRLHIHDASGDVEIIGVSGELRAESGGSASAGSLYLPMTPGIGSEMVLHVRVNGSAMAATAGMTRALRGHNGQMAASNVMTLGRYMESAKIAELVTARVSAVLALLQLALAIAGLSGLVAYVTAQRRREIGIRTALGADRASIIGLVMRQGVRLTMIGGAIGIALSFAVRQIVAATLPVNATIELRAMGLAVVCFAVVAGVAMLLPARRALSGTPAAALRVD